MLGWGAGVVAHGISAFFEAGPPAKAVDRLSWQAMRDRYGDDWRSTATKDEYEEVRRQVSRPFEQRKGFAIHFGVFLTINLLLFILAFIGGDGSLSSFGIPLLVFLLWGSGVATHGAQTFVMQTRDRAIEREVQRERERLERELAMHKRKRSEERLQLGEDGEFDVIYDDEDAYLSGRGM